MKIRRGTIIHFMKGVVVDVSHTHKLFETWQRGTRLSWRRAKQVASGKYFILFGNFIRCELLFSLQNGPINWNSCSCSWFRKVDSTGWWQHMNRKILYWSIQSRMYFSCQPSQVKSLIMNLSVWPNRSVRSVPMSMRSVKCTHKKCTLPTIPFGPVWNKSWENSFSV